MSAIDFVVRGDTGVVERGAIGGTASDSIVVGAGQEISLNLQRNSVLSYTRNGQALEVTLVDGQVVTLQGFFSPDGIAENQLFLSANGQLAEVDLVAGEGNLLYGQYVDSDSFGKWSPDDALYFVEDGGLEIAGVTGGADAGMLGVPLLAGLGGLGGSAALAAAGLGGAALLSGGGGGDSGVVAGDGESGEVSEEPEVIVAPEPEVEPEPVVVPDPIDPPVVGISVGTKGADHVVNNEDYQDGVALGGTGTPGATGTITVGDVTKDIVIDEDGNWTATLTPDEIDPGEYEVPVEVTVTNEGGSTTSSDVIVLDTFTTVTFDPETVEGDGTVNFVEESDGVTLTGSVQEGSTVEVSFADQTFVATVEGDQWALDIPAGVIAGGEYDLDVTVTATDEHGNTASAAGTVQIDTVTDVSLDTSAAGGDGTVNEVEHPEGVAVNGLAEANASVVVTAAGVSQTVMADADGVWSATFDAGDIPTGTYDLEVTAVATDIAGNTATASGTVQIDTELTVSISANGVEGDGIVNAVEQSDGVDLSGATEAGASVVVTFGTGERTVTADENGVWRASFTADEVPTGEFEAPVTATATDAAGNVATTTRDVTIDTEIAVTLDETGGGADGIINGVEHADGVDLAGTSDANASVSVEFQGVTRTAVADADGNWSVSYSSAELPGGNVEMDAPVAVTATDIAGNVATTTGTVTLDTYVNELATATAPVEGDDVVNNAEAADGITLNGVVEAGSTVTATFEGVSKEATVNADGSWSVSYAASEIPSGTYDAVVRLDATDAAGNTASINETFAVDTDAPEAADVTGFIEVQNDTAGAIIRASSDVLNGDSDVSIHQVGEGAADGAMEIAASGSQIGGNVYYGFDDEYVVPNGSHLIVQKEDDAGNTNSTLMVLDVNGDNDVDVTAGALEDFNIGAIDLEHAENSIVDLSSADLEAMSANDNILVIHGRNTDQVNLEGAATQTGTETINGKDYDVYSVGADGGQLIINSDIEFNQNMV